ncbi:MAG: hemolysin D [Pirellulaceae bacterium]|nr:MAG: hemolysin D [Pirellulaceae bacterium]
MLILLWLSGGCAKNPPTAVRDMKHRVTPVRTVEVQAVAMPRRTIQPATVRALYHTQLRPRIAGYVGEIDADIGQVVEAGAVLAVIEVPEMDEQRRILLAELASAQARRRRYEAEVELAGAELRSATARLAQAESEAEKANAALAAAEAEFQRTRDLVQRRSLEPRLLDEVRLRRDAALAEQEAAKSTVASAQAAVGVAEARVAVAQSELDAAQAAIEVAQRTLAELETRMAYREIKAPFRGVITERQVELGQLVAAEGSPLFTIAAIDRVRVQVPIPEADVGWVGVGQSMELRFPAFPAEQVWNVAVTRTSTALDEQTRTMIVEAEFENTDRKLLPGMFGVATITSAQAAEVAALPARALRFTEAGEAYVYAVADGDTVRRMPVTTGQDTGHLIEILAGIEVGTLVVDAHLERFEEGQPIRLVD